MTSNWTPSSNSLFHNNNQDDQIENNLNLDYVQKYSECNEFIFLDHCKDQENQIQNIFSETQSNGQQNPQGLFYQQKKDLNYSSNNQTQKDSTTGSQNGKASTQEQELSNYPPSVDNLKFPKLQKRIKKQYQPLYDNEMYYDYNVDPEEYKKARKRIQNRQSATRIRHRKANNFQSLEQQFEDAINRNTELMLENARLQAENNLLQQQLQFLQKILMKERNDSLSQPENINMNYSQDQNQQQYVLPVSQVQQDQRQQKEIVTNLWTKIPGNSQGKENRNLTFLGMMTMIFCCIAFFSTSTQDGKLLQIGKNQIDMTDPQKVGELFKSFELQPKSQDPSSDQQVLTNAKEIFIATLIQEIVNKYNNKHQIIFEILEIGFLIIYCAFIIFVGVKLVVNYLQDSKKVKIKIS